MADKMTNEELISDLRISRDILDGHELQPLARTSLLCGLAADLIETQAKEIESLQSKIKELEEKINPPKEEHPYFREYS